MNARVGFWTPNALGITQPDFFESDCCDRHRAKSEATASAARTSRRPLFVCTSASMDAHARFRLHARGLSLSYTAGGCPWEAPRPLGTGTKMRLREKAGRHRPFHASRTWRLTPLPASTRRSPSCGPARRRAAGASAIQTDPPGCAMCPCGVADGSSGRRIV